MHRLGQTRPVNIYRLVSKSTCEERILHFSQVCRFQSLLFSSDLNLHSLAQNKASLSDKILDHKKSSTAAADHDDAVNSEAAGDELDVTGHDLAKAIAFGAEMLLKEDDSTAKREFADILALDPEKLETLVEPEKGDWQTDFRFFEGQQFRPPAVIRTISDEWATMYKNSKRKRQATTVEMSIGDLDGTMAVSRWSVEEQRREQEQADRLHAMIAAKKAEKCAIDQAELHLPNCLLCTRPLHTKKTTSKLLYCMHCPNAAHEACVPLHSERSFGYVCSHHACHACGRPGADVGGLLLRSV